MNRWFFASLTVFAFACATLPAGPCDATEADYYVSPQGSDTWSGRLAEPSPQRTDGPFASLARARDAVRESLNSVRESDDGQSRDVVVLVRGSRLRRFSSD